MYVAFLLQHSFHANCRETLALPFLLAYAWLFLGSWDASLVVHWHESTCENAPSRETLIHHQPAYSIDCYGAAIHLTGPFPTCNHGRETARSNARKADWASLAKRSCLCVCCCLYIFRVTNSFVLFFFVFFFFFFLFSLFSLFSSHTSSRRS